jgi:phage-related minor tail protein
MADTNYVIDLILEAKNNATAELNKIGGNIDQLKEKSIKMSESTKTALNAVGAAATAVAGAVIAVGKKAVDSAVQMEPVKNSFERLSDSVGVSADEMLKAMQKASKGTVSNFNLMSAANKAYSL